MKRIIIPISMLCFGLSNAQTTTENYIQSRTYLEPVTASSTTAKQINTVQYFDGLGRPKQVVNVKASPLGRDVVTHIEYDQFGRQVKDYLPVPQPGTLNGAIVPNPLANATQPSLYGSEKIYAEKILENSPLDRIQQQIQVGNAWSSKPVKFTYETNAANEVKKFIATAVWSNGTTASTISSTIENYPANQLYKNIVTDEDGNQTIEFKNGQGQVILVRKVLSATENADTYYVYNDYNQLAVVISPMGVNAINALAAGTVIPNNILNGMCYLYRYDGKNRVVLKKVPHKGWEYIIYDKAGRVIMTQDAVMGASKQWLFTKYDAFGRVAYTGIYTSAQAYGPGGRQAEQAAADALASNTVKRTSAVGFTDSSGMQLYYDNTASTSYPSTGIKVLSINYYDTYPGYSFNPSFPADILGEPTMPQDPNIIAGARSTKGLPVMSFVKNVENDNWTRNYSYYDRKGRVIGTYSINHLGGYTRTDMQLDFAGTPLKTITSHQRKQGEEGVTVKERFVYDTQNRLKQHYHQVDNLPEELLAEHTYNELSQLSNKKVGNNLQSIDYAYNIRGWMTDINKNDMSVANLGGKLFAYKIKYNQKDGITNPDTALFPGKNVEAKFNGNITEVDWRAVETVGVNPSLTPKRYGYAYDKLNRLTAGFYQNPSNPNSREHTESISYDINGNIKDLYRTSLLQSGSTAATVIDRLSYTYIGNQLSKVVDSAQNPTGYEGGGNVITYTANGSMKDFKDRGITSIQYNHLELPDILNLTRQDGIENVTINTVYDAGGLKLQKINNTVINGVAGPTTTRYTTDYLDGFQYTKKEFVTSGGSESFSETAYAMEREAYTSELPVGPIESEDGINPPILPPPLRAKTGDLQFFGTSEGYFDYEKDQYIYQYKDHLGNVRVSFGKNSAGALEITDANDYYPFGMNHLKTGNSYFGSGSYKNYKYNSKELQETGMYDYGARMYMADLGRWGVVDPLAEQYRRWSPYNYAVNNPMNFIDPDGRGVESTHTDKFGNVVMVANDGDNGVYKHSGDTQDTLKELGKYNSESNTSAGGERMGETEFWDEFVDPDTNMAAGTIHFGNEQSWDPLVVDANEYSKKVGLQQTMEESKLHQGLDIKNNKDWSSEGPMTGRLLNGKYATGRSAGNYLAGLNGVTSTLRGFNISGSTYMKMAGAYQKGLISTPNKILNYNLIGSVLFFGNSYGPAPYYGEEPYSGRRILEGIKAGEKANNK